MKETYFGGHAKLIIDGKMEKFKFKQMLDIMKNSTNIDKRNSLWKQWRDSVGKGMRYTYPTYMSYHNMEAKLNNYTDYGQQLRLQNLLLI